MPGRGEARVVSGQACLPAARTCNLYCVYCHLPPSGRGADPSRACAELKRRGVKAVSLEGGGEPAASPETFRAWVKNLRGAGVERIMLSTNGVAFADRTLADWAAARIDAFTVNFPSHSPAAWARAARSTKYRLALAGLRNLAAAAPGKVRLFQVVYSGNYRLAPAFARWAASRFPGLGMVNFAFVHNAGRVGDSRRLVPSYASAAPFLAGALRFLRRRGVKVSVQNMPLCVIPGSEGFALEFQRWRRGDRPLDEGVRPPARAAACRGCTLAPACCGARPDYIRVRGAAGLRRSAKDPSSIEPAPF